MGVSFPLHQYFRSSRMTLLLVHPQILLIPLDQSRQNQLQKTPYSDIYHHFRHEISIPWNYSNKNSEISFRIVRLRKFSLPTPLARRNFMSSKQYQEQKVLSMPESIEKPFEIRHYVKIFYLYSYMVRDLYKKNKYIIIYFYIFVNYFAIYFLFVKYCNFKKMTILFV